MSSVGECRAGTRADRDSSALGLFGGSFDPIHFGHLRAALELAFTFDLPEVRLIPNGRPPHRESASVGADQRLAMIDLAIANSVPLVLDRCEVDRKGASYTFDTLAQIRDDIGPTTPLIFGLGADAFENIENWYRADELLNVAHLAILSRPGSIIDQNRRTGLSFDKAWTARQEDLREQPFGRVYRLEMTPLAISSTRIREQIARGWSPRFLLPETVCDYIETHKLYR